MTATEQTTATASQQACITDGHGETVALSPHAVTLLKHAIHLAKLENQFRRLQDKDTVDTDFESAAESVADARHQVWQKFTSEVESCA